MHVYRLIIYLLWGNDETSYLNAFVLNDLFAYNKKLEKKETFVQRNRQTVVWAYIYLGTLLKDNKKATSFGK